MNFFLFNQTTIKIKKTTYKRGIYITLFLFDVIVSSPIVMNFVLAYESPYKLCLFITIESQKGNK